MELTALDPIALANIPAALFTAEASTEKKYAFEKYSWKKLDTVNVSNATYSLTRINNTSSLFICVDTV